METIKINKIEDQKTETNTVNIKDLNQYRKFHKILKQKRFSEDESGNNNSK